MSIRRASAADLGTLQRLWQEFEDELDGPEYLSESWEDERKAVEKNLREGVVLIAEEDGEPAGYAELHFEDPRLAWLKAIYVRPAYRRQGVARALLAEVAAQRATSARRDTSASRSSSRTVTRSSTTSASASSPMRRSWRLRSTSSRSDWVRRAPALDGARLRPDGHHSTWSEPSAHCPAARPLGAHRDPRAAQRLDRDRRRALQ